MIYSFGPYELDTRVYELRHAGRVRPVEPQVFDVLAYLLRNRDRVISKEELLDQLWPERFVSETTLTSRLKEVRKAVGDTGRQQSVIRTLHGRGYRFVADVEERDGTVGFVEVSGDHLVAPTPWPAIADAPVVPLPPLARSHVPDFVGRRTELARLGAALDAAVGGQRQIVFVAGEAGAGKTTLVETFLYRCSGPIAIARGQCLEHRGSGEAYMPLLDALGRLCHGSSGRAVIEVLRRDAPSWLLHLTSVISDEEHVALSAKSGTAGERMLREIGMALERLASQVPLILAIEDLHWSDYATLDAIDLLARRNDPARLMVIGTYRPADVKAARHPVHALCQELRVRRQCELISLPLLVSSDLDEYLKLRFGSASFAPELTRILEARTAGNPLFVGNLVDSWIARGLIRQSEAGWELQTSLGTLETDVPDSLQSLIEKQVGDLDAELQRMLETASTIGRTFPVAAVAAAMPLSEEEVEQQCEELARQGRFVRHDGTGQWGDGSLTSRFAFVHDLYPDVLQQRIPTARRARVHRQVGLAIERAWNGREREHAAELALHFQRAHDADRSLRYLQLAAGQALERSAYREAVVHLTAAVALVEDAAPSKSRDRSELEIRCRLAPALIATRGWADLEAEENYVRARQLARELREHTLLSQTLYGMANMYEYRGEYRAAELIANERMLLDGEGELVNALESHELLTCSMLHQGRYRESVEHGEKALAAFSEIGAVDSERLLLMVQAYGWVSGALHFAGRADDAIAHSREALRLAAEGGDDLARASSFIQAGFLRYYRGDAEECRALAQAGLDLARERRFPFHAACGRILSGWWMATAGEHAAAAREIRAGIRTCSSIGARMDLPLFLAILSEALRRAGDDSGAIEAINEALSVVTSERSFFYVPELHRARALLRLKTSSGRGAAFEELRRALALSEEQGSPLFALRVATTLAAHDPAVEWKNRLAAILDGFRQGHDTADFVEAREVLSA